MSAPTTSLAVKILESCQQRVTELSAQVDGLSRVSREQQHAGVQSLTVPVVRRSRSLSDLVHHQLRVNSGMGDTTMESATDSKPRAKKPRRCHQCHTPLEEPVHSGIKTGVGNCTLPHWDACDGNIPEGDECRGKLWAPCPESEDSDSDPVSGQETDKADLTLSDPEEQTTKKKDDTLLAAESASVEHVEAITVVDKEKQETESDILVDSSSSDDEENRKKQLLLEKLQKEVTEEKKKAAAADLAVQEKKHQKRLRREQRAAALAEQEKLLREQLKQARSATSSVKPSPKIVSASAKSKQVGSSSAGNKSKNLSDQAAEHEARQQRKAAERREKQKQEMAGLSIAGIRKLPDVQRDALELMSKLQEMIPSLAKDPNSASGHRVSTQPPGVFSKNGGSEQQHSDNFVYVASLGRAVPVVNTPADLPNGQTFVEDSDSDEECSADDDCPLSPEPGHRFLWRRNANGSKYFVPVPVKRAVSPGLTWTYVLDKATGRYEKRQVSAQQKTCQSSRQSRGKGEFSSPRYRDHRVLPVSAGRTGQSQHQRKREERQPTYVCPDVQPEKQGKDTSKGLPELVHYARECPVSWTSKVTTDKLNPILWSWAYVSQLLATRTGQAPELADGELEARLQHFLSVLEVTLQTTAQSDFASDAWKVARLYHVKVQQKVDSGDYTWVQMLQQWGTATSPHELMAARAEIPLTVVKQKATGEVTGVVKGGAKGGRKDEEEKKKQVCFSWNNCETRGKCKFEVENDGEDCPRIHACSWCKSKDKKPLTHQKRFCRKRIEEEGE